MYKDFSKDLMSAEDARLSNIKGLCKCINSLIEDACLKGESECKFTYPNFPTETLHNKMIQILKEAGYVIIAREEEKSIYIYW